MSEEDILGRGNGRCKGPGVGTRVESAAGRRLCAGVGPAKGRLWGGRAKGGLG